MKEKIDIGNDNRYDEKKDKAIQFSELKAFILVGGLGTRLKSVISEVPKPMAPIEGKPFLYYKLMQMKQMGIKKIVFCSGYMHEIIEEYFGNGSKFGLNIEYSIEKEPLGTAGAIKNAESFIDGPFFMMNGDTYLNVDFKHLWKYYLDKKAYNLMLLTAPHLVGQEGIVVVDPNMKILEFLEKPGIEIIKKLNSPYINGGVYLLQPDILNEIPAGVKCSIEKDVFPKTVGKNKMFFGCQYDGLFIDIGIPKNYEKFISLVKEEKIQY